MTIQQSSLRRRLARGTSLSSEKELRAILVLVTAFFCAFLALPAALVLIRSLTGTDGGASLTNYVATFADPDFLTSIANSLTVSCASALVATGLAFLLSYTVNCTNVPASLKRAIGLLAQLPMLLPTITYGFAIIYTFGRQGLLTRALGFQAFDIYGFNGLLMGYVIYTLPTAFLLIDNSFRFIDKRYLIVSRVMGDSPAQTFVRTIVRPLAGALCVAFIQSFFLAFTDYGIPTSVGGQYNVLAMELYSQMLGAIPDFGRGATIAVIMLVPSAISIALMYALERHAIRYNKVEPVELPRSRVRDVACGTASVAVLAGVLSVFAVILIVPFIEMWPFKPTFTWDHVASVFTDPDLAGVFGTSLAVAALSALAGCTLAYAAALVTARSNLGAKAKRLVDSISSVINAVPGMVLGIAFLLAFAGTPLQGTLAILVICNVVHYFATPYQMMKDSLTKMNASWETTARLMGDSWIKTILRVVTPNAWPTLLQVFGYYFVSSMVTISAVVFLTSARTMVVTTKISALQHVADFDSIFALSLAILVLNLGVKGITALLTQASGARTARKSIRMRGTGRSDVTVAARLLGHPDRVSNRGLAAAAAGVALILAVSVFAGTGGPHVGSAAVSDGTAAGDDATAGASSGSQVIIYSNADQEALDAYRAALDKNGYAGDYIIQAFGTSELGGKLVAEGSAIEADVITMSSYYIDSAQADSHMFADLAQVQSAPLDTATPAWRAPVQAQEGAIFYNTQVLASEGLPVPASFKDLADPVYRGMVSVPDISGSSTGWLMIQAIMDAYGDEEGAEVLTGIYRNAGPYLSQSGSAPIKNVRAGEVAIGFGLRHQALSDRASGLPIEVVEPREGTYSLTESVAVVDHGEDASPLAQEIAAVIVDCGRKRLMNTYPKPLYQGEAPRENSSSNPKEWPDALTVPLLEINKEVSERCRRAATE